jgi:hypothetical protein
MGRLVGQAAEAQPQGKSRGRGNASPSGRGQGDWGRGPTADDRLQTTEYCVYRGPSSAVLKAEVAASCVQD